MSSARSCIPANRYRWPAANDPDFGLGGRWIDEVSESLAFEIRVLGEDLVVGCVVTDRMPAMHVRTVARGRSRSP